MADQYPHRITMHYDSTRPGIWIGHGRDMHPVCGQSEFIGVTDNADGIDCLKCKAIIRKEDDSRTAANVPNTSMF